MLGLLWDAGLWGAFFAGIGIGATLAATTTFLIMWYKRETTV